LRVYCWTWASTLRSLGAHRLLREARELGITDLLLLVKSISGRLYLEELIDALTFSRDLGLRVHAWVACFKDESCPSASPLNALYVGRLLRTVSKILSIEVEGSRVAGIHLDYVRFLRPVRDGATLSSAVTRFVAEVRGAIESVDPSIELTAATIAHRLSSAREVLSTALLYGQDYVALSSLLDAVIPMAYHLDVGASTMEVIDSLQILSEILPTRVVAGLQMHPSENPATLGREPSALELRQLLAGLRGQDIALFRYSFLRSRYDIALVMRNFGAAGGT